MAKYSILLRPDVVAERLSLPRSTVYHYLRTGIISCICLGRGGRVSEDALNTFLSARGQGGADGAGI